MSELKNEKDKIINIDISKNIINKVEKGEVRMRERWKFVAEKIGLESGILLGVVLAVLTVCLLMYFWKKAELSEFTGLGYRGWRHILLNIPYAVIGVFIVLFVGINYLIKKLDWGYKKNWFVWGGLISVIVIALALTIYNTRINEPINDFLMRKPPFGRYLGPRLDEMDKSFLMGEISKIETGKKIRYYVLAENAQTYKFYHEDIKLRPPFYEPKESDKVRLVGKWNDNEFEIWAMVSLELARKGNQNHDFPPSIFQEDINLEGR